jgi:carbon-monoxide dehydrogenase small subunit
MADAPLPLTVTINGHRYAHQVEPQLLLAEFLRDHLHLTGTHVGCDTSQCGACTVLVNGQPVKSCTMLAIQADGAEILTIEGLAANGQLHPVQEAFTERHALQCGFCTPGVMMTAVGLLAENPHPTEPEIREGLDGVICRCTGYENIVSAIARAAELMAVRPPTEVR